MNHFRKGDWVRLKNPPNSELSALLLLNKVDEVTQMAEVEYFDGKIDEQKQHSIWFPFDELELLYPAS